MGFHEKVDYSGIGTALTGDVLIRDDADNRSAETYAPQGQDGSVVAIEVFGEDTAPSNNFAVIGNISTAAGDIKLGKVTTVNSVPYGLESITITTAAGAAPTISAKSQELESTATDAAACHYSVPALALTTKNHAQILFGAFSAVTGTNQLTACSATISCTYSKVKVAGVKKASDISSGMITVTGTILQVGSTAPTLSPTAGWTITSPLTCTNPETAYKSYTFELKKSLAKDAVQNQSAG